jgi:chloride channel 3/4/5
MSNRGPCDVERARKTRGRINALPCLFTAHGDDDLDLPRDPGEGEEDNPEQYFAPTTAGELQFTPWVNKVNALR